MPDECFTKELQTTAQTTYQMKIALNLDVVACPDAYMFGLLASKGGAPLVRWDAFLVVDVRRDVEEVARSPNVSGLRRAQHRRDGVRRGAGSQVVQVAERATSQGQRCHYAL